MSTLATHRNAVCKAARGTARCERGIRAGCLAFIGHSDYLFAACPLPVGRSGGSKCWRRGARAKASASGKPKKSSHKNKKTLPALLSACVSLASRLHARVAVDALLAVREATVSGRDGKAQATLDKPATAGAQVSELAAMDAARESMHNPRRTRREPTREFHSLGHTTRCCGGARASFVMLHGVGGCRSPRYLHALCRIAVTSRAPRRADAAKRLRSGNVPGHGGLFSTPMRSQHACFVMFMRVPACWWPLCLAMFVWPAADAVLTAVREHNAAGRGAVVACDGTMQHPACSAPANPVLLALLAARRCCEMAADAVPTRHDGDGACGTSPCLAAAGAAAVGPGPPLRGRTLLTHVPGWVMPLCWQRPGGTRRRTKAQPHVVTLEQVRAQRLESLERHNPSLNYSHVYVWHCFRLVLVQ